MPKRKPRTTVNIFVLLKAFQNFGERAKSYICLTPATKFIMSAKSPKIPKSFIVISWCKFYYKADFPHQRLNLNLPYIAGKPTTDGEYIIANMRGIVIPSSK